MSNTIRVIIQKLHIQSIAIPLYKLYLQVYFFLYKIFVNKDIVLRRHTSDLETFGQMFVLKEYKFDFGFEPKFMIDAGANVGYATLFFKKKFSKINIIALEPEKSNFNVLEQNTQKFSDVTLLQKGLWRKKTRLSIETEGHDKWGFTVKELNSNDKNSIQGITVDAILAKSGFKYVDILKIDIEGSEKEVFEDVGEWIDKVNVIFVETHDRFKDGSEKAVKDAIDRTIFDEFKDGENLIFVRKNILK